MMIDQETLLSDKQAVTSTAKSTDVYQISDTQGVDLGPSQVSFDVMVAAEDFAGNTNLEVQIIGSQDSGMGSPEVILSSGAILLAKLKKGRIFAGTLPIHKPFKYIAFNYVVSGTATKGKINAILTLSNASQHAYNSSYNVTAN
ncbi:hypothetical protein L4D77_18350 [Photobacterium frigidiphilum]|uniref:Bbp16 family capsid cement protein n=1 Tax=Photobacterium frigidiphilum TaxID=264736 RepID=UPI003D13A9EA